MTKLAGTRWCIAAALVGAALPAVSVGASAPRVDSGWPISSLGGELKTGPGTGVLEVGNASRGSRSIVALNAFRASASRLWSTGAGEVCGNCARVLPDGPRIDGSYAPFGLSTGASLFAASRGGARTSEAAGACVGLLLADGTCISVLTGPGGGASAVRATRGATTVWEYTDPALKALLPGTSDLSLLTRDGAGTVFVSDGSSLLVALDERTGEVRWRQSPASVPGKVLSGLDRGVLVGQEDAVVALSDTGSVRWRVPVAGVSKAVLDNAGRRVYAERSTVGSRAIGYRVLALDLDSGAVLWQKGGSPGTRLLSASSRRLLVAADSGGGTTHDLVALKPNGSTSWSWRALGRVQSAATGRDGHVFADVENLQATGSSALLHRLNPAAESPGGSAKASFRVTRRAEPRCGTQSCTITGNEGTVLKLSLPRATRLSWAFGTAPLKKPYWYKGVVNAPAGSSSVRLFIPPPAASKALSLKLTWRTGARIETRTIAIPVRG